MRLGASEGSFSADGKVQIAARSVNLYKRQLRYSYLIFLLKQNFLFERFAKRSVQILQKYCERSFKRLRITERA